MKQFHISLLTFLGCALLTMGFQCGKDYSTPMPTYEYAEKLTLTPYRKTYAIGDTIWVQFQTAGKNLFDKLSGNRIATDTTFLRVQFQFHRRYPNSSAAELFSDVKVDNGLNIVFRPSYPWYNLLTFNTDCSNSHYFFKVGFVPKKTGVYSIEPSALVAACPNKLSLPYSTFMFNFDLSDCNKDVWLSIPPHARGGELGHTDVMIDKKEIFVFKVE